MLAALSGTIPQVSAQQLFEDTILQDLESAANAELLEWAVTLGLSSRGSRREIEDRILEYYGLARSDLVDPAPTEEGDEQALSIATIRNARGSDYFTIEETDERYLRLVGGVELTMEDGDSVHTISAEELTLNLEENTIAASGGVEYTVQRPGETETFNGDAVVFNIRDWDGVFLRGITDSGGEIDEEAIDFAVSGERISRSTSDVVVIDDGVITSSTADPPNYEIRARRIWILAPGEWGIRRAVLRVGRVPMFYFPYFFIPGDRLFFNPAVGSRSREGTFIQTTTYIFGESPEKDPPFSIMQISESPGDEDREIQGLFLRIPEEPKEPRRPDWTLKVMADIYTQLGYYGGIGASMPNLGPVTTLDWRLGIGTSRNIYDENGTYSSFYVDETGRARRRWNSGYLLDRTVPFRYESELDAVIDVGTASLSVAYEMFSDTRFRSDYGNRAESIDWNALISQSTPEETETTAGDITSLRWESRLRWTPRVPGLSPWVTNLSLSGLRAELRWNSRENADLPPAVTLPESDASPERLFFYPDSAVFPDLIAQVDGSILRFPRPDGATGSDTTTDTDESITGSDPADGDATTTLRPPWDEPPEEPADREERFILPEEADDLPGIPPRDVGSVQLTYSLRPTLRVDRVTDNAEWTVPEEVGFAWQYSTLQNRNRGNLALRALSPGGWMRYDGTLAFEHRYQSVDFLAEIEESRQESLQRSAYAFRGETVTQNSATTGFPLLDVPSLEESTIRHEISSRVYDRSFESLTPDGSPRYIERYGDWSPEGIDRHAGIATVRWDFLGATQSFRAETVLPPLDRGYFGDLTVVTGPLTSTLSAGYRDDEEEGWIPDPLVETHSLSAFDDDLSFDQRLEYDLEETELVQARSILGVWPLRVDLQGRKTTGLEFRPDSGWTDTGEPRFQWTSLAVGLEGTQRFRMWKRRIDLGLRGVLAFDADLREFTRSGLVLDYGFDLDIYRFLTLELAARSRNDLVYQYVPRLAEEVDRPYRDPLEDLVNSLRLFDTEARQDSFFKIESIEISAVHDLEDWELSFSYIGGPELTTEGGTSRYVWQGVFAVLFQWRPISEIRRDIRIEDGIVEFIES